MVEGRSLASVRTAVRPRLPAIAALALSLAIAFDGLNGPAGKPILFLLLSVPFGLLLFAAPPSLPVWRALAPIVALAVVAQIWMALPLWVPPLGANYARPDLLLRELLGAAALLVAFCMGAVLALRRQALASTIDWLLAFACANALLGVVLRDQAGALPSHLWQAHGGVRFAGTMSNSNVTGAYFAMLALAGLTRVTGDSADWREPLVRAAMIARCMAVLLCASACLVTASRSANTCLGLGLTVILLAGARRRDRRGTVLAVVLSAAVLTAAWIGLADLLQLRLNRVGGDGLARMTMWQHYLGVSLRSIWFGYGAGGFATVSARSLSDPFIAQLLWTVNAPHNLFLGLLLEGGIGYLLLLAAAAALVARRVLTNLRHEGLHDIASGVFVGILAVFGCAMVDIALDVPALAALTLFLAGMLAFRARDGLRLGSSAGPDLAPAPAEALAGSAYRRGSPARR